MKNGKMIAQVFVQDGWDYNYDDGTSTDKSGYGSVDGHDYVEIGGVKWATMNVGATTVAGSWKTCYGDYYRWSETKINYTQLTSPNPINITLDGFFGEVIKTYRNLDYQDYYLDDEHDVAKVNWGAKWRMPSYYDFEQLIKACNGTPTPPTSSSPVSTLSGKITQGGIYFITPDQTFEPEYKGVYGLLFVASEDITKRLFFPSAGTAHGSNSSQALGEGELEGSLKQNFYINAKGWYWAKGSRPSTHGNDRDYDCMSFDYRYVHALECQYWYHACPVRAVVEE